MLMLYKQPVLAWLLTRRLAIANLVRAAGWR